MVAVLKSVESASAKLTVPGPSFQFEGAITTGYSELGQPYSGLAGAFVPLGSR